MIVEAIYNGFFYGITVLSFLGTFLFGLFLFGLIQSLVDRILE